MSTEHNFRDLHLLRRGDEVIFTTGAGRFRYVVSGTSVVGGQAMHIIDQTGASTATLFACHPPGSTRFVSSFISATAP